MVSAASSTRSWSAKHWRDCQVAHLPGYDPYASADGYVFDVDLANRAVRFFDGLQFIEGEKAGQPFSLEPWQKAIIGALFGWKDSRTGLRRYRESFIYVPRKNGKSPLCAGIVLLGLFVDDEPGAQIYSAAAEREQAALVYRHAAGMIAREPTLARISKTYKTFKSIEVPATNTFYKALSADADTKHGFSSHIVIVDELHAHPNGELVDVLQTSTGARRQPLIVYITTADYQRDSICNRKYDYASKVRDSAVDDKSFLPVIYEAKPDDDWTSPKVWARANPNLDVSVKLDYLERECKRAQAEPSYENTFKRLHLNIRTQQDVRWLPLELWDAGGDADPLAWRKRMLEELRGKRAFAAFDLATTKDITALCLYFPDEHVVLPWFFVPGDNAEGRERRDRVPYPAWARQGWIDLTPGNVVDYERLRAKLNELADTYQLAEVAGDPWNATHLMTLLQGDGFDVVQFRQGYASMSPAAKEFEKLLSGRKLMHGGNPVLRWMASNVSIEMDAAGNIKPSKAKSTEKIDGIVAAIMCVGRAMVQQTSDRAYDQRGVLVL